MQDVTPGNAHGPHLVAALLCEYVLTEGSGVNSLVRLVDRINATGHGPAAPDQMPTVDWRGYLFVAFRSGDARGPVPIKVTLTKPSGLEDPIPVFESTVHFEGGTHGNNVTTRLALQLSEAGPYWFNIYVGGRFVTKTNLEVIWTVTRTGLPR